ncbi:HAMP domain-containing sensor histidine kinase [Kitasatospora sp. MAP5-34]|uniref:sensor histidine kinase n=1 Tax=Kitasatospora sp. MAP5-34 TaxID=3035102 RepID=UPI0024748639|nr:HAMP domain-containing sensor histidine kinase [Kitasatospora sp. MAP5-34]MDH6579583.1 two-component system sensor histidine kinase MprB [Kitasatospora sp. MAP5-34]
MLTAAAVAVAIALSALACWFVVERQVYQQVKTGLAAVPAPAQLQLADGRPIPTFPFCNTSPAAVQTAVASTRPGHRGPDGGLHRGDQSSSEGIFGPSRVCLPWGATKGINTVSSDLDALSTGSTKITYRSGSFVDGTPATVRVALTSDPLTGEPYVLLTAAPLSYAQDSLRTLALILLGVAALGVVGAGVTGRIVARSALKPVDDLTDVVEHIARTEEVGSTIPVHGNDEIARLAASFNSMSTALANSRDRQTRLIADAGHELRTPLTSLRTNVDLMIRSDDTGRPLPPATRTKLLGNMKAQMQELTLLIGDLLQLSRPDSPKPGQNRTVVALHEIADRAVERARLRGPGLVFDLDINPWYVHGDGAALERAVINLLDNAVKYSPPGGSIQVALQQGVLTVRDHGPGIPTDELQYVFDRFWRSPSSRQLPGSGLGLSIVAQTIRDTEGEVSLGPATDGGPGALATVRLPGQADVPQ